LRYQVQMKHLIDNILSDERQSKAVIWMTKGQFEVLLATFEVYDWVNEKKRREWKRWYWGKNPILIDAKTRLFFLLQYIKTYPTYDVIWALWNTKKTTVSDRIRKYLWVLFETLYKMWLIPTNDPQQFKQLYDEKKNKLNLYRLNWKGNS